MIEAYLYPTITEFNERMAKLKLETDINRAEDERMRQRIHDLLGDEPPFDPANLSSFGGSNRLDRAFDESGGQTVSVNERRVAHIGPFFWVTHKNVAMLLSQMATPHLFFTIRMLFNNTVPPVFRVGKFKRRADVQTWSKSYLRSALYALTMEFLARDSTERSVRVDDDSMQDQFDDIVANVNVIQALKI